MKPDAVPEGLHHALKCFPTACESEKRALLDSLERLAEEGPDLLKNIVESHDSLFVEWASQDNRVLDLAAPYLRFETSLGRRSLIELCEEDTTTWFMESEDDYERAKPFASSLKISVVNAGSRTLTRLLHLIAREWPRGSFCATTFSKLQVTVTRELGFSASLRRLLHQTLHALRVVRGSAPPVAAPAPPPSGPLNAPFDMSPRPSRKGLMPDFMPEFDPAEPVENLGVPQRLNHAEPLVQLLSDPSLPESTVHSVLVSFYHHALTTVRHHHSTLEDETYYVSLQRFLLGSSDHSP